MMPERKPMPRAEMLGVSASHFGGREREYVADCLDRNWITQGVYVKRFEQAFAQMCGARHAVACSSGTAALHLALIAAGVGADSTVIVPALTYVATANAARYCGAKVVFADVNLGDWCMSPESCAIAAKGDYDAVAIPVHLFDAMAKLPSSLVCVEDAAHVPGSRSWGGLAAYSFYASKLIACGEGGMVTTDDDSEAAMLRLYRGQGAPTPGRYYHSVVGYNYRLTDVQAAIGLAQLERLPATLASRRAVVRHYRKRLEGSAVTLQEGLRASGWMFAVLLPDNVDRDRVAERLSNRWIETRPFFDPIPSLPPYRSVVPPIAANVARRGLCLPTHTSLVAVDIDYICECLLEELS